MYIPIQFVICTLYNYIYLFVIFTCLFTFHMISAYFYARVMLFRYIYILIYTKQRYVFIFIHILCCYMKKHIYIFPTRVRGRSDLCTNIVHDFTCALWDLFDKIYTYHDVFHFHLCISFIYYYNNNADLLKYFN